MVRSVMCVLLFALTLPACGQDKPKQDCYEPGSILTMNFAGKDSFLVISNIPKNDGPRVKEVAGMLMKKYDRDLPKVKAALKSQFPYKIDIIEASAYDDWKEELMRNAKPCTTSKQLPG
jgi:hypothetical protein